MKLKFTSWDVGQFYVHSTVITVGKTLFSADNLGIESSCCARALSQFMC
jgi:hypothetical protein